jgi:pimeloyl-ACP methyl ester carboxylesterase
MRLPALPLRRISRPEALQTFLSGLPLDASGDSTEHTGKPNTRIADRRLVDKRPQKTNIPGRILMTNRLLQVSSACLVAGFFAGASAQAKEPKLETTDTMIPSGDAGVQLFVRNKHPSGKETSPDKILLFVHGATYPAETAFDLPIEGVSMMDLIAARGYDVYLVDVRGYGRSTRPAEMSQPPEANKPIVSTKVAAHDLGAAVDYVLRKRKVSKINVMGWSWGTSIAGLYTSEHNDKVNRLVLLRPAMDSQRTAGTSGRQCAAARRLPAGFQGRSQSPLVEGSPGKQAGGFDPARRVRCLGNRNLGKRSRIIEEKSADAARAQWGRRG